jgi:hypothetical protein
MSTLKTPISIEVADANGLVRQQLERYVQSCFADVWGANIDDFMPWLMGLRDRDGVLDGVLGLRPVESGPLFLEQYLDEPVEVALARLSGEAVSRDSMVEVGNLASNQSGGARWLITALTAFLHAADREWVVFTGGPVLRNAFTRLGLPLILLGEADPARLQDGEEKWGSYYSQRPMVMAGRVADGYRQLSALLAAECALSLLWRAAGQSDFRGF